MASSPKNPAKLSVVDYSAQHSMPHPEGPADAGASVTLHATQQRLTTCCKCHACTCGPECSFPEGERAGCDPCVVLKEDAAAAAATTAARLLPNVNADKAPAIPGNMDPPPKPKAREEELGVAFDHRSSHSAATGSAPESISTPSPENPSEGPEHRHVSADTGAAAKASGTAIAVGGIVLTPSEQQALRKERRNHARNAKLAQTKGVDKAKHVRGKRRWARGKNKKGGEPSSAGRGGSRGAGKLDVFDEWLGMRLRGWVDGEVVEEGGCVPPFESGILDQIDFNPSTDEIGAV